MKKLLCIIGLFLLCGTISAQENHFATSIEVNGSVGLDDNTKYSFGVNFIGGYQIGKTFFIGAGVGYTYFEGLYYTSTEDGYYGKLDFYDSYDARSNVQVFARAKLYLSKSKVSPFLLVDVGGTFGLTSNEIKMANGLMYEPAIGLDIDINAEQAIYVMIGYKSFQYQYKDFDLRYSNVGDKLCKENAGAFCLHLGFKF